jgi:hypothetical protein
MDTRRSYYLQSNKDDFSELDAETRQYDTSDVLYVTPANDTLKPRSGSQRAAGHCFVV